MGLKDRAKNIQQEKMEDILATVPATDRYKCVVLMTWPEVERFINIAAQMGWSLHTLRDGIRAFSDSNGYRLIMERDQIMAIDNAIAGVGK